MRKRVLVVEDYKDVRRMMRQFLEKKGFDVIVANDGAQAVEKAVSEHPDLIMMDLAMPGMDGIQATQAIRKYHELDDIPILALTAYADFYDERARDVGCNDVIQKPIDFAKLEPIVNNYMH
jgi:two-component system, cell cycle response regulator DivK